jgi:putative transcriptional regulator
MSTIDTSVKVNRRDGRLFRELADGSELEIPVPPGRAMTEAEIHTAAEADPDNPPLSSYPAGRLVRRPRVFVVRRALKLTAEEFAERYQIPAALVREWEAGASQPDGAAVTYLAMIAHNPDGIAASVKSMGRVAAE